MRKNDDRKLAEQTFLTDRGRITNKEIAKKLKVHPATVARWKKLDEWDLKLLQSMSGVEENRDLPDDDFFAVDLRHISLLNERIDAYLQRKELLPSEIRELAEAKFRLISCTSLITDQARYPMIDAFDEPEEDFD